MCAGILRCSLAIETDNLVAGSDHVSSGGAGGDAALDATKDVTLEAGSDAIDDSQSDSPMEAEAEAGKFCESLSPQPTLCSDFDTDNLPSGWDDLDQWGACAATIDNGDSTSPPRSLLFSAPALASGDQCGASLRVSLPQPTNSVSIEFDLYPEALSDTSKLISLANITMDASGTDSATLLFNQSLLRVNEQVVQGDGGSEYAGFNVTSVPQVGVWSHVIWDVSFTGSEAFSNVNVNGAVNGGGLLMKSHLAGPNVRLGIIFADGVSGPWKIRIDNVVVRID